MKRKIVYSIFLISLIYFLNVKNALAVTTSISNPPQSISAEPFTIKVTVSGASTGINYLRIDLYKPSTTNYFGETFNGLSWYSGSDHSQYYSIAIQSGIDWSSEIQGKVGNPNSTQYDGPGTYKLRVRRYTSSGNYNTTEANNSAVDVNINLSLISPTPLATPTTSILTPTDTPIPIPSPIISPTISEESNSSQPIPTPQSYPNIFLSEVMVYPESNTNEWLEIYNDNDFSISLDSWYIDDLENGGTTPKKFSIYISAKSYGVYELSTSMFNNDGDSVRLLDFDQKELDSFQYQSSEKGKTLGRTSFDTDNFCLQTPSKNTLNSPCINPTATLTAKSTPSSSTPTVVPTNTPTKTATLTTRPSKAISTITPAKFSLFTQDQSPTSELSEEINDEVLGITAQNINPIGTSTRALLSSLSFASFAYSLLVIISILLKMKMG
ncbi:lamin tail domain-containing protein [Candidatus Roizmanbacteria bacterium]|nr:lamin tail domain-containing protein [Candidatus Roizmanbacteria bacterium]